MRKHVILLIQLNIQRGKNMNTKKIPRNKLSIYLIKEDLSSAKNEDLLNDREKGVEDIKEIGEFHYGYSKLNDPSWLKKFFDNSFNNYRDAEKKRGRKLFSAAASGVLFVDVEGRKFAITFGHGYMFLKNGVYEERFGLKSALNLIQEDSFRAIEKKNMNMDPKLSIEQVSKNGEIYNFGLDVEQDLVQAVTGKSSDKDFGNIVTGKDVLSVSIKCNINDIKDLLSKCLIYYKSDKYKENFGWIDHIKAIKIKEDINKLDEELVGKINSENFDDLWMSIPEIIEWENLKEFMFNKHSFGNDIDLETYLSFVKNRNNLSLANIKAHAVEYISADTDIAIHKWKVYNCLYCEINDNDNDNVKIFSGGLWYEIEKNFTNKIKGSFDKIREREISLPLPKSKKGEHEDLYNERAGKETNELSCMDRKFVNSGVKGHHIEFCDLLTIDKEIIHVKRYGSSSVFSHLFEQGVVSGTLFNEDESFLPKLREKLGDVLGDEYKEIYTDKRPVPNEYKVIYAIISAQEDKLEIPFFSKISIRNAKRRLEGMGYEVYLYHIPIDANDACIESNERRKKRKSNE